MRREFHVRFYEGGRVRFPSATRLIVGFQHEIDARRFLDEMRERYRMLAKLRMVKEEMRGRMHQPIAVQGKWLWYVVRGYFSE